MDGWLLSTSLHIHEDSSHDYNKLEMNSELREREREREKERESEREKRSKVSPLKRG